ncbi:PREDICTED: protein TSSC4-like isoform X2 [Priapulus caudatus]|uniref:U5 small nuclear ribonucleoprotein TSSC4 n=1 Tax=Priapulus caudatus TaxID=37621 RepID=A0ABM1ESL4_PRICU|nr:PREDICTED: protein TSSC4-like isoform X2 [Priapulus caudatus]XP_014675196.1 PREDICTED: protein TSSC4-like isoform X2 [Priapulus caudatus]
MPAREEQEEAKVYSLPSADDKFLSRTTDVFGCLQELEDKHKQVESSREKDDSLLKPEPEFPQLGSSGPSGFLSPHGRAPRSRNAPGFKKEPKKWTCYSLADVSNNDMSEATNTSAALGFLEEQRKLKNPDTHTKSELVGGHSFSKRKLTECSADYGDNEPSSNITSEGSGKIIMPQCVVGRTKHHKPKPVPSESRAACDAVGINYLQESFEQQDKQEVNLDAESKAGLTTKTSSDGTLEEVAHIEMSSLETSVNISDVSTIECKLTEEPTSGIVFKPTKKKQRSTRAHVDGE